MQFLDIIDIRYSIITQILSWNWNFYHNQHPEIKFLHSILKILYYPVKLRNNILFLQFIAND